MKKTPAELRPLEEENTIVKTGVLKHDLYTFDNFNMIRYVRYDDDTWLHTKDGYQDIIDDFSSRFKISVPKGTKFNCYYYDAENHWFDDSNIGVEEMCDEWAEKNLENIIVS